MAVVPSNRQSWWPPVSDNPTPDEIALHLRLLFSATNDHDQAFSVLKQQQAPTSTTTTVITAAAAGGNPGPPAATIMLETNGALNAIQTLLNLISGANITLTADGAGGVTIASTSTSVLLETNSVANASQSILNLIAGTNVTITDGGGGAITIAASGGGGTSYTPRSKTANYTAIAGDVISCDTTAGGFTITLPASATNAGAAVLIKKISTDANTLTVGRTGADLLDGATSQVLTLPYASYLLVADGTTNWGIF